MLLDISLLLPASSNLLPIQWSLGSQYPHDNLPELPDFLPMAPPQAFLPIPYLISAVVQTNSLHSHLLPIQFQSLPIPFWSVSSIFTNQLSLWSFPHVCSLVLIFSPASSDLGPVDFRRRKLRIRNQLTGKRVKQWPYTFLKICLRPST